MWRIKLKTASQTFIFKASNVFHWSIPYGSHMDVCWLVVFSLMSSPKIWSHHWRRRAAKVRFSSLCVIRPLSREGLLSWHTCCDTEPSLCGLTCRTAPFRLLVRLARDTEDLLWPGSPRSFGMQAHNLMIGFLIGICCLCVRVIHLSVLNKFFLQKESL